MHNEIFTKIKWLITYKEIINACPKKKKNKKKFTFSGQKVFFSPTTTEASDTRQGPDHSKEQLTGSYKLNMHLLRMKNDIIIPIYPIIIMYNKEDCHMNCIQTAVSSLTFCRLPGFNCVLSIILIAT